MFALVYFFVINKIVKRDFLVDIKKDVTALTNNNINDEKAMPKKTECVFVSNQDAIVKAMESGDDNICNCVSVENEKDECILKTNNIKIYKQAFRELNIDICNGIKEDSIRQVCQSGVTDAIKDNESNSTIGEKDLTIEDYEKIREIEPNNVNNLISLARGYSQEIYAENEGEINRTMVDKVFLVLNECKKYDANNIEIYELEGYVWEKILEYDKSLLAYNKGLELSPNSLNLLVGRSKIYVFLNRVSEAVIDLKKAATLDISKENKNIYMTLCNIYADMNNQKEARENCEIIIKSDASDVMKNEASKILELLK